MKAGTLILLLSILMQSACGYSATTASSEKPEELKAICVQMHVHGSMSELTASMRGTNLRAREVGIDVLWWSDHDWRIAYFTYLDGFDFEMETLVGRGEIPLSDKARAKLEFLLQDEPSKLEQALRMRRLIRPTDTALLLADTGHEPAEFSAEISTERAFQGTRSLKFIGRGMADKGFSAGYYDFETKRKRAKRSLASKVKVRFSIFPETEVTEDILIGLRVALSQQPPDHDQGHLFYVLTGMSADDLSKRNTKTRKYIKLPFDQGKWNSYEVDLTDDAERYELGGIDNSLCTASFGMQLRSAEAVAFFDDYRIEHELAGAELVDRARVMARELSQEYGVINYIGQEISYQAHLNALGDDVPLIDHEEFPLGLSATEATRFIRKYNGLSTLNHVFGVKRRLPFDIGNKEKLTRLEDDLIEELAESNVHGADVLEVGYVFRGVTINSYLRVWDELSARQIYVTANGVNDSHGNHDIRWLYGSNFVTWVWARSPDQEDIVDALRRGRCFFGDPAQFKGTMRISSSEGASMGQVVMTDKPSSEITIDIEGLEQRSKITAVVDGKIVQTWISSESPFQEKLTLPTAHATFIRVAVHRPDGSPLLFSNPIYYTTGTPESGIPEIRQLH